MINDSINCIIEQNLNYDVIFDKGFLVNVGPRICLGVGILCFIVLACVPGCYNLFTPKSHSINIGAVDDWGGELGAKGRSCHRGLLMAVEEVNKAGGKRLN